MNIIKKIFELDFLDSGFQAMVFCRYRIGAEKVYEILKEEGYAASLYHGDLA